MKKPELIEDWRECWRFWSVRLAAVGTAITGLLVAFPDAALAAWAAVTLISAARLTMLPLWLTDR